MNRLRKCGIIYTMEYYSAIKKEIMSFSGTMVELENIMLSAVSQNQKEKGYVFSFICGSR
jgi:hypothetical protein